VTCEEADCAPRRMSSRRRVRFLAVGAFQGFAQSLRLGPVRPCQFADLPGQCYHEH
jgi:hypothetical protein